MDTGGKSSLSTGSGNSKLEGEIQTVSDTAVSKRRTHQCFRFFASLLVPSVSFDMKYHRPARLGNMSVQITDVK